MSSDVNISNLVWKGKKKIAWKTNYNAWHNQCISTKSCLLISWLSMDKNLASLLSIEKNLSLPPANFSTDGKLHRGNGNFNGN